MFTTKTALIRSWSPPWPHVHYWDLPHDLMLATMTSCSLPWPSSWPHDHHHDHPHDLMITTMTTLMGESHDDHNHGRNQNHFHDHNHDFQHDLHLACRHDHPNLPSSVLLLLLLLSLLMLLLLTPDLVEDSSHAQDWQTKKEGYRRPTYFLNVFPGKIALVNSSKWTLNFIIQTNKIILQFAL